MPTTTTPAIGRFEPTWESLKTYRCPDWFRDAKLGFWAHWGPQAVPMVGDWYARHMYVEGHPQYLHHLRTYGHPSQVGYKDIVKLWRAERFDPERLIALYKAAGARYFTAMAVHHDNFDCWNSRHHRWNSVEVGPKQDIVGLWAKAARAAGLRFGVTEHLERSYSWFGTNKGADRTGPRAGVPYDGNDPAYRDLYHEPHGDTNYGYPLHPPAAWVEQWSARLRDLIDQYDPDLLYTDGGVPFGQAGLALIAHYYNRNCERRGGRLEAVYTLKDISRLHPNHGDYQEGIGVLDMERGVVDGIHPNPWQTDTCVGGWYYCSTLAYKTPGSVVAMLADIVSKNGNLLLNFPPRPDGTLDEQEEWLVGELGKWVAVNGEAIFSTRPWCVYGEGPTRLVGGAFAEKEKREFTAADFRFTTRGDALYAICLGRPTAAAGVKVAALGTAAAVGASGAGAAQVRAVSWLGVAAPPAWRQEPDGLVVSVPASLPGDYAWTLKVMLAG